MTERLMKMIISQLRELTDIIEEINIRFKQQDEINKGLVELLREIIT